MCGITAIISPAELSSTSIAHVHKSLSHRGPNASGTRNIRVQNNNFLYLLHHRLSILDLSLLGTQPMTDTDNGCVLIFNGEIYNFREIRDQLQAFGYQFKTDTDTEVVLQSYKKWGEDCIHHFNGMFSIILWDPQLQELFIARDRFGEKPLYFAATECGEIIFSSEMKAILSYPNFKARFNYEALDNFLKSGRSVTADNNTPFENISQVSAAHLLKVNTQGTITKFSSYWSPKKNPGENFTQKDLSEEFLFLLENSVRDRANCDVQVGACLSGGLDSTSIVGLLNAKKYKNFSSTISVRFDNDLSISEGTYLDAATNQFKGQHHMISPTGEQLLQDMDRLFWHHEAPLPSASMYLEWSVMKKAREVGNTVMLDGQGADELLGGYPYYFSLYQKEMLYQHHYLTLIKNTNLFKKFLKIEAKKYLDSERRIPNNIPLPYGSLFSSHLKQGLHSFKGKLNSILSTPLVSEKNPSLYFSNQIEEGLSTTILQEQLHSADRNGMAFGIETRFPFLDYNLVDFALKLQNQVLINEGMQKYILREAVKNIIPEKIRLRKDKLGFLAPQDRWLLSPLKDWSYEMISAADFEGISSYNKKEALEIFDQFHERPTPFLSSTLWRYASLGQFLTTFKGLQRA